MKVVCITGHRPKNLPWGYNRTGENYKKYLDTLSAHVLFFVQAGFVRFISGMAQGADMDFAETVLLLKQKNSKIFLECALPCLNQTKMWSKSETDRYNSIITKADKVTYISESYSANCMMMRNKYMVDMSNVVIAVWNGEMRGGTWNTIEYARGKMKPIDLILVNKHIK